MNSPKPRSVFSAICRSNGIILGRMRATVGSRFPQNASRASASHRVAVLPNSGNVVASILPVWRKLRRTVELTQAPVLRTFSSPYGGHVWRLICNLLPVQVHTGKCSFLRVAFVNDCRQPANRIANILSLSPVLSLSALCHAKTKAWSSTNEVPRNSEPSASGA